MIYRASWTLPTDACKHAPDDPKERTLCLASQLILNRETDTIFYVGEYQAIGNSRILLVEVKEKSSWRLDKPHDRSTSRSQRRY